MVFISREWVVAETGMREPVGAGNVPSHASVGAYPVP